MSTATPINNNSMALSAAAKALPLRIRRSAAAATIATSTHNNDDFSQSKNVVVLGGSYGGMHAATLLAQKLPPTHRVILIDQNSHFNHLYVFPRFSVLPGHEQKAFIPYTSIFSQSPDRTKKQSSSSAERNDAPSIIRATTATAPTFDLEMGSTASATRESPATTAMKSTASPTTPSSTAPSSSSSSTSSFSLSSPIEDDYSSSSSSSDENHHPSTNSSLLFDRQAGGPHSTRSVASTLSSLYTASSDSRGTASTDSGEEEGLVRKLESNLHLAEVVQEQEAEPIQTRSVNGAKVEFGTEAGDTLRVVDEVSPAEAVHEQEALGRQPMRVETEDAAQSEPEKEEEVVEAEGNTYEGAPPHVFLQATVTDIKPDHVLVEVCPPRDTSATQGTHTSNSSSSTSSKPLWNITSRSLRIPYTHLIYALGSHLPDPLRTEARTKGEGMNWMREIQERVRDAEDIVLVGGGALGVQFASDIASVHGTVSAAPHPSCATQAAAQQEGTKKKKEKRVTLIHSRQRLLPNFDERIHEIALKRLTELGVDVVLGERLALTDGCPRGSATVEDRVKLPRASIDGSSSSSASTSWTVDQETTTTKKEESGNQLLDVRNASAAEVSNAASRPGRKLVRTTAGKLFHADVLLLCTGQQPNSSLLGKLSPSSVDPRTRLVKVRRTLQVERLPGTENWGGVMEAKAPCGDCDCFIDRKTDASPHEHLSSNCDCGLKNEDAEEEVEDRSRCLGNVYAIGDCADAFGALNAGYQAWAMADVAAENVLRDLGVVGEQGKGTGTGPKLLKRFKPVPPMLKLSLGLGTMAWQGAPVPHRVQPRRRRSVTSTRTRSGTVSEGSITPTLSSIPVEEEEEEEEEEDAGEMVMKPEVMEKEDPFDLGVEGVWKYMANADTEDLYL
ncbi:hypothetical protein A4X09_0g3471 [Tilletia walkeri]|uniref:FAD/NAD(P)-binding domain-containing protein n=1 Tax=Tilletia walkeri TaxID=117179 RepID=A0A8X7N821_9BASI|nr:hypothetical protein A4X09_0g3471 [Tilletia walkeri]